MTKKELISAVDPYYYSSQVRPTRLLSEKLSKGIQITKKELKAALDDSQSLTYIKYVIIRNQNGEVLTVPFGNPFDPDCGGLDITSIDGIDPGSCEVNISENTILDGGRLTSSRLPSREITISMLFVPRYFDAFPKEALRLYPLLNDSEKTVFKTWGISDCRAITYRYFSLATEVTLYFVTADGVKMTTGVVSANEQTRFEETEGCDITIKCPDPYFYDETYLTTNVASELDSGEIVPAFAFPFANDPEVVKPSTAQFIFSTYNRTRLSDGDSAYITKVFIDYKGDEDTGCSVRIRFNDLNPSLLRTEFSNRSIIITDRFDPSSNIIEDKIFIDMRKVFGIINRLDRSSSEHYIRPRDELIVSSYSGKKSVTYYDATSQLSYNVIGAVPVESKWVRLNAGPNYIGYGIDASEYSIADYSDMTVSYYNRYEGV